MVVKVSSIPRISSYNSPFKTSHAPKKCNAISHAAAVSACKNRDNLQVKIDFGDGECVPCNVKHQADFRHMLHSVHAAGVRRKGANGFPIYDSPLLRDIGDLHLSHDYIVWPVVPK